MKNQYRSEAINAFINKKRLPRKLKKHMKKILSEGLNKNSFIGSSTSVKDSKIFDPRPITSLYDKGTKHVIMDYGRSYRDTVEKYSKT